MKDLNLEPNRYIVMAFETTDALETYINKMAHVWRAVSIADTNRCITVLMERREAA